MESQNQMQIRKAKQKQGQQTSNIETEISKNLVPREAPNGLSGYNIRLAYDPRHNMFPHSIHE